MRTPGGWRISFYVMAIATMVLSGVLFAVLLLLVIFSLMGLAKRKEALLKQLERLLAARRQERRSQDIA